MTERYDYERALGPWPPLWFAYQVQPALWSPAMGFDFDAAFECCRRVSADKPDSSLSSFILQSWLVVDWETVEPISPLIRLHFVTVPLSP